MLINSSLCHSSADKHHRRRNLHLRCWRDEGERDKAVQYGIISKLLLKLVADHLFGQPEASYYLHRLMFLKMKLKCFSFLWPHLFEWKNIIRACCESAETLSVSQPLYQYLFIVIISVLMGSMGLSITNSHQ